MEITFTIDEVRNMLLEIEAMNSKSRDEAYRDLEDDILTDATCGGVCFGISEAEIHMWDAFNTLVYKAHMDQKEMEEN